MICSDPRIAQDMIGPRVLGSLDALGRRAPMVFERGLGVRIDPEEEGTESLVRRLSGLIAVARYLPRHTVEDHGRWANSPGPLPSTSTPGGLTGGYRPDLVEADKRHKLSSRRRKYDRRFTASDQSPPDDHGLLAPDSPAR